MTIQIPDDLARGLEGIAAEQRKSVEQVALDSLRSLRASKRDAPAPALLRRTGRDSSLV
jgi:hypothetical protein